jgi:phenylpropionate dioxygenase-like ring-hydroxylating dioxygenase large terminal subunit
MTGNESVTLPLELDRPLKQAEPALRGDSITADRYTSNNYLQRELDQVWRRVWNIGGVSYQMTEPGDYLTAEIGHESVILVRQADGSAKAFLNVCPHRGTRITESTEGAVERFHCA